jgi:hypothetical protein
MFIEYTMGVKNKLKDRTSPSGLSIKAPVKPTEFANVPCSMWKDAFMNGFLAWDAQQKESPRKTLFTLLGSKTNALHMVNAESKLNGLKAKVGYCLCLATVLPFFSLTYLSLDLGFQRARGNDEMEQKVCWQRQDQCPTRL